MHARENEAAVAMRLHHPVAERDGAEVKRQHLHHLGVLTKDRCQERRRQKEHHSHGRPIRQRKAGRNLPRLPDPVDAGPPRSSD